MTVPGAARLSVESIICNQSHPICLRGKGLGFACWHAEPLPTDAQGWPVAPINGPLEGHLQWHGVIITPGSACKAALCLRRATKPHRTADTFVMKVKSNLQINMHAPDQKD